MFLIYLDEASAARSEAEVKAAMASHTPYIEMLRRNGKYVASDALGPSRAARTLRSAAGKPLVTDGPFAESREQLGGYYVVDAKDLDEAIAIASKCPAVQTVALGIEIRPMPGAMAPERGSGVRWFFTLYRDEAANDDARDPPLAPSSSATTLRLQDGKIALTDGPFSEGRVQIAGYRVVPARDIDEAVTIASEELWHAVEVRSIRT
jgi:hypothetical protein